MNILITGGAGFIGSHLAEYLLEQDHTVTVVDNFSTGSKDKIRPILDHPRFSFFEMSVDSEVFIDNFLRIDDHFDQIYHLACPTGVPNCVTLSEEMIDACSFGVKNVLRVAREHESKFLVTSSSEIYGDPLVFPQTEEYTGNVQPVSLRSPYEEGKRFTETITMMFHRKYGVDTKIVRLFNVYGPRMSLTDTRVIPRLATQALRGERMTVHNGGDQTRTFCYVSDIINGIVMVMNKGVLGNVYNVGGDKEVAIRDLAILLRRLVNSSSEIEHCEPPLKDHMRRKPLLDRVFSLGWRQSVGLEDGLRLTIDDFRVRLQ